MSLFKNAYSVLASDVGLLFRKLIGCKVNFNIISLVSLGATLKTKSKGNISLGRKTAIRSNTELSATEGKIIIGNNCFVNRNCMIVAHDSISIGDNTTIGPGVYIYDHDHDGLGGYSCRNIVIGDNVWIGAGCIILKGVKIGSNSVIGAGSLILKDIPENSICYQKRSTVISERVL